MTEGVRVWGGEGIGTYIIHCFQYFKFSFASINKFETILRNF